MGFSIGNLVSKVLPKVGNFIENIASSPVGKLGLDILKQLASSAFSKDGSGGLFSENFELTLPNPLSRLNKLLGDIGKKFNSVSDFLKNIGDFLQGKRKLEDGKEVDVPRLGERAETTAKAAASTAKDVSNGNFDKVLTTRAPSTSAPVTSAGGGALSRIDSRAFTTSLSPQQNSILDKAKAAGADETQLAQMRAQMELSNLQNLMQFISNIMKIMSEISRGVIANIR